MMPLLFLVACLGGGPTLEPPSTENLLQCAHVLLDGVPVEGTVVSGERGRTLFRACIPSTALYAARVESVMLHYDVPATFPRYARRSGVVRLCDDGTLGDDFAGDGVFQLMDMDDDIGCGRAVMPAGVYVYTFQCLGRDGRACGQQAVRVDRR